LGVDFYVYSLPNIVVCYIIQQNMTQMTGT
jgi:hypothetical protein